MHPGIAWRARQLFRVYFSSYVDEIDFGAIFSDGIDFDLGCSHGHHHCTSLLEQRTCVGDSLSEIARRSGDDVGLPDVGRNVVGSAKLEAAGVLERLTRQHQIDTEFF